MRGIQLNRKLLSRGLVSLLSGLFIILLFSGPVFAQPATVTVDCVDDEFSDPGPGCGCTLREAIETFNRKSAFGGCTVGGGGFANDETDTIDFEDEAGSPDTYTLDISGFGENDNATGDLDLTVSATILGNGKDETIITTDWSDTDKDRVLHIYCDTNLNSRNGDFEDCDPSIEVNIFGLTIQEGDVSGEDGTNDPADGGGILFEDLDDSTPGAENPVPGVSTLEIGDEEGPVVITDNFALNGGGVAFKGLELDIMASQIFGNTAGDRRDASTEPALGGGIFAKGYAGPFEANDDTDGSSVFITDSSIIDNVAQGAADAPIAAGAGVALAVIDQADIEDSFITGNRFRQAIITFGAGLVAILVDDVNFDPELELFDTFITENDGSDDILSFGGGMAVGADGAAMGVFGSTIAHNLSASGGGIALFNSEGLFFEFMEIFDVLGDFGGLDLLDATYIFNECSIFNNEANGDPALSELLEELGAGAGLDSLNILGVGGGLFNLTGDVDIRNCTISNNRATFDGGGLFNAGIAEESDPSDPAFMEIRNTTITLNQTHGFGGGIRNDSDVTHDPNALELDQDPSTVDIFNTILAGNIRFGGLPAQGDECFTDDQSEIVSGGFNIFGEPPTITTDCNLDAMLASDQSIDPADLFVDVLFPFVDSPGFFAEAGRQHHPLRGLEANIAIDEADETICTDPEELSEDQLEVDRVEIDDQGQDCANDDQCCDVGAIEYNGMCGDGTTDEVLGEECDDGGLCDDNQADCETDFLDNCSDPETATCEPQDGDGCDEECILEVCGNGKVQEGEECDDGNGDNTDACLNNCMEAECGDGFTWVGMEDCDDFGFDTSTCNADCSTPVCGDEILNIAAGEQCDPVGGIPTADCDDDCSLPFCGDENLNTMTLPAEECDPPGGVPSSDCNFDCTESFCGDGIQNMLDNEACDDGNTDSGDGCDANCELEVCGDGFLQANEDCEPGIDGPDMCDPDCTFVVCGDKLVNMDAGEQCDDGGTTPGDGCDDACQVEIPEFCGDGVVNGAEDCEPITPGQNDANCNLNCTNPDCGDSILNTEFGEECEDGNTLDGDGCSADCQLEGPGDTDGPGECGNGVVEEGEDCDDGNTEDGDGCSADCQDETDPAALGGSICGSGCGSCTESDERIDLSNIDPEKLPKAMSLYTERSIAMIQSNTYLLLFFLITLGALGLVRSRFAYRRK